MSTATPIARPGPNDDPARRGPRLTQRAQRIPGAVLRPGDWAVDATVGRGRNTLFLVRTVGRTGRVIGCDLQQGALEIAAARLRAGGLEEARAVRGWTGSRPRRSCRVFLDAGLGEHRGVPELYWLQRTGGCSACSAG